MERKTNVSKNVSKGPFEDIPNPVKWHKNIDSKIFCNGIHMGPGGVPYRPPCNCYRCEDAKKAGNFHKIPRIESSQNQGFQNLIKSLEIQIDL